MPCDGWLAVIVVEPGPTIVIVRVAELIVATEVSLLEYVIAAELLDVTAATVNGASP